MTLQEALEKLQEEGYILSDGKSEWEPWLLVESVSSQKDGEEQLEATVVVIKEPDGHISIRENDATGKILYKDVWEDESPQT